MKKFISIAVLLSLFSTSFGMKGSLKAYFTHASFYSPENGPYIETYLSILGKSVQFIGMENGKFKGTVIVTMLFKQNDSIREFRKYDLHTIEIDDTANVNFIVFDQQRIAIASGKYDLDLELDDKNTDLPSFTEKSTLDINFETNNVLLSDIETVESYTEATESSLMAKSGYDFLPFQDYYYPQNIKKITFYAEVYNASTVLGNETPFAVATYIQSVETGKPIDNFFRIKRETSNSVNIVFSEFDISELPSGNYNLVVSIRDKENKEIAGRSIYLKRSNPGVKFNTVALQNVVIDNSFVASLTQPDTLREYIRMCFPIGSGNEKLFINSNLKTSNLLTMQQFFLNFWSQRNPANPQGAWATYYNTVLGVEKEFGSIYKKGYETDRGRVYLQYGSPNERTVEALNPWTYPYEIWHYYAAAEQTNLKFVFYTRDKALNDYLLAHSTANGEVKNVEWQNEIKRKEYKYRPNDIDNELYKRPYEEDIWGEHTGENFNIRR
ncbi:MAG: GWxTD domain-containing protein [Bacteroidota bacterium]